MVKIPNTQQAKRIWYEFLRTIEQGSITDIFTVLRENEHNSLATLLTFVKPKLMH